MIKFGVGLLVVSFVLIGIGIYFGMFRGFQDVAATNSDPSPKALAESVWFTAEMGLVAFVTTVCGIILILTGIFRNYSFRRNNAGYNSVETN